jgi:hypothetical protein
MAMKVFDFTNGKKGELLGEVRRTAYQSGWLVRKGNKVFKVELANAPRGWSWQSGAGRGFVGHPDHWELKPEDFGVSAICFSVGEWSGVWQWTVLGTEEWNRKACKCGILKYTVDRILSEQELADIETNRTAEAA